MLECGQVAVTKRTKIESHCIISESNTWNAVKGILSEAMSSAPEGAISSLLNTEMLEGLNMSLTTYHRCRSISKVLLIDSLPKSN